MSAGQGAAARARAYGVPALEVDGMDVEAVYQAAGQLVSEIRQGLGPRMLHARTYRYKGHVSVDPAAYRNPQELKAAMQHDALAIAQRRLVDRGVALSAAEAIAQAARDEVAAAVASALDAAWPDTKVAFADIQSVGANQWR